MTGPGTIGEIGEMGEFIGHVPRQATSGLMAWAY